MTTDAKKLIFPPAENNLVRKGLITFKLDINLIF